MWSTLAGFASLAKAGEIALDIGANSGFFTNIMAGHGLPVHSFEPSPGCCKFIKAANLANGFSNVVVHQAAVSSRIYTIEVPPNCDHGFVVNTQAEKKYNWVSVSTASVMPLFDDPNTKAAVIKIDAEGSEIDILHTIEPLLAAKRVRALVVEIVPTWWKHTGVITTESGLAMLHKMEEKFNFEMFLFHGDGNNGYIGVTAPCDTAPIAGMGIEKDTQWLKLAKGKTLEDLVEHSMTEVPGGHGIMAVYVLKE